MATAAAKKLIQDIKSGTLDSDLDSIKQAVEERIKLSRAGRTLKDFPIGAKIRLNEKVSPQYMIGKTGTVVGHKLKKVVITIDKPEGRFGDAKQSVCPVDLLDLVKSK